MFEDGVMPDYLSSVRMYFTKLGVEPEIANLYFTLTAFGPQTISELARNAKIERTRIYRLLDALQKNNLAEVDTQYKRHIIRAAPIHNLQLIITRKEEELRDLHSEYAKIEQMLSTHSLPGSTTHIQFYKGIEGVKQLFWNQTKGHTENLAILYENMQNKTNETFFVRWAQEFNKKGIRSRGIICQHFLDTQTTWYKKHDNERLNDWQQRFLPDSIFPITHSSGVYDDVVMYYKWQGADVFGIEIHNKEIANTQRAFFEMLWQKGDPNVPDPARPNKNRSTL